MSPPRQQLTAIVLVLAGCASPADPPADQPDAGAVTRVSFADEVQPIFDRWCVGCHDFHTPHLTAAESYDELLTTTNFWPCIDGDRRPFVVPGDPDASYLHYKISGQANFEVTMPGCRRLMPTNSPEPLIELDPAAVETIRTWIAEGATRD